VLTARRDRRVRVLHCFRSPVGGLFRHVRDQVQFHQPAEIAVGIVCGLDTGGDEASRVLDSLAPLCELGIYRIPLRRTVGPGDWLSYQRTLSICRNTSPTILHGHGAKGGALARLVAHQVGARAVYTPHGGVLHYNATSAQGWFYFCIERLLRGKTDGIIFESRFAEHVYNVKVGARDCPLRVVHNGLAANEFTPLVSNDEIYDFVFVGELRILKGVATLIDALSLLRENHVFRMLLVGDGPEHGLCVRQIRRYGLETSVDISPPVHPGRLAFGRGKCIVVPSLRESFPYVVLEAAAARRPIIASNAGGIAEILAPQAGALVAPGDPRALADAMSAFLDNPSKAVQAAGESQSYVERHFRAEDMAQGTADFYREIEQET